MMNSRTVSEKPVLNLNFTGYSTFLDVKRYMLPRKVRLDVTGNGGPCNLVSAGHVRLAGM